MTRIELLERMAEIGVETADITMQTHSVNGRFDGLRAMEVLMRDLIAHLAEQQAHVSIGDAQRLRAAEASLGVALGKIRQALVVLH